MEKSGRDGAKFGQCALEINQIIGARSICLPKKIRSFFPIQFAQTQEFRAPLKKIESEQLKKDVPAFRVLRTRTEMLSKSFRAIQLCDFQQ
jgi:hypothetical protein